MEQIGPGTDMVVYRLSKDINIDASVKVPATTALWKIVWPKIWVMSEFRSSFHSFCKFGASNLYILCDSKSAPNGIQYIVW